MDSKSEILIRELEMDERRRMAIPLPSKMTEYLSNRTTVAVLLGMAVLMLLIIAAPSFITTKNKNVNLPLALLFSGIAVAVYMYLPSIISKSSEMQAE